MVWSAGLRPIAISHAAVAAQCCCSHRRKFAKSLRNEQELELENLSEIVCNCMILQGNRKEIIFLGLNFANCCSARSNLAEKYGLLAFRKTQEILYLQ
jgi:hypothetical protein